MCSVAQLSLFHGIDASAIEPPALDPISDAKLDHLVLRSYLIDADPTAADGHENTLFDVLDIRDLRALVREVWQGRTEKTR